MDSDHSKNGSQKAGKYKGISGYDQRRRLEDPVYADAAVAGATMPSLAMFLGDVLTLPLH